MTADHPGLTCAEAQELIDHYREHANETSRLDRSRFPAWLLRFVTNLGRPGTVHHYDGPGTTHNQPRAGAGVVYHYDHCSLYDIFAHDYDDCPYNDDGSVKHPAPGYQFNGTAINYYDDTYASDGRANHPAYRAADLYPYNDASAAHEHYDNASAVRPGAGLPVRNPADDPAVSDSDPSLTERQTLNEEPPE